MKRRNFLGLLGLIGCKDELEDMNIAKKLFWLGGASGGSPSEEDEAAWSETYTAFAPVYTGFSVDPIGTMYYKNYGGMVHAVITVSTHGTSNATTFTMTLPIAAASSGTSQNGLIAGSTSSTVGRIIIADNSNVATLYSSVASAAWPSSGNKSASFSILYEASGYASYTPTFVGFSVAPTVVARHLTTSKLCHVWITSTAHGTSNATNFTFSLPQTSANNGITQYIQAVSIRNNSGTGSVPGVIVIPPNSTTATVYRDGTLPTWTASGQKSVTCSFQYETI